MTQTIEQKISSRLTAIPFDLVLGKIRENKAITLDQEKTRNYSSQNLPQELMANNILRHGRSYRNAGQITLAHEINIKETLQFSRSEIESLFDREFERMKTIYKSLKDQNINPVIPFRFETRTGYLFSLIPYDPKTDCIFESPRTANPYYSAVLDYDFKISPKLFDRVRIRFS